MICNEDAGGGKAFRTAVLASRVVLPNGAEAERMTYDPTGWWLLDGDDEYWVYTAEVIDLAEHLSFCAGNVVKYVCRAGRKDPDKHVEDLEKARWYIDREIERVKEP